MTGWTVTPPSGLNTSPSNDTGSSIGRFGAKGLGEMLVNSLMEEPDDKVQVERICAIATWHLDMLLALKVLQSRSMIVKGNYSATNALVVSENRACFHNYL